MMLSPSDIADSIERKFIEAVVVMGDDGCIDPIHTTVTKLEAARLVDAARRALADTKAKYMDQKKDGSDPAKLPERQAGVYRLHEYAALAGLTALEAARLLLIREGALLERHGTPCTEVDAPPLAKRLLTLKEMQKHGAEDIHRTIHPLSYWLKRASAKGIEYISGLDFAVAQDGGSAVKGIQTDKKWAVHGSWAKPAREIGIEWMQAERSKTGKTPGIKAIAAYVEGELTERNIKGARGKFLDAETIKREALTGITGRKKNGE